MNFLILKYSFGTLTLYICLLILAHFFPPNGIGDKIKQLWLNNSGKYDM